MRPLRPLSPARRQSLPGLDKLIALALCVVGLLVVTCVTSQVREGRWAVAGDAHYVFAAARSVAYDGDLDLQNQLTVMGDRYRHGERAAADGFVPPPRELGPSLVMVPGLWLHHLVRAPEALEPAFAAVVPSLSMGLSYLLVLIVLGHSMPTTDPRARRGVALVAVLGGVLPFYAVVSSGYPHAADAVVGGVLALVLIRDPSLRRPALAGVALAAAVLVRLQNALWLAWPIAQLLLDARSLTPQARRQRGRAVAIVAAIGALGSAPLFVLDALHPGSPGGAIRWGLDFFDPTAAVVGTATVLWGVHGLWSWTPLMLVGSLGLGLRREHVPALAVLVSMIGLMAITADPEGGFAFGARRLCGLTALIGIGLGAVVSKLRESWGHVPHGFRIAAAACVVSNLYRTAAALVGLLRLS